LLQGTVSGVTTTSGAPGAALDIRIRGIATNETDLQRLLMDILELGLLNPNDVSPSLF
jgi:hypothetical protein